MEYKTIEKENLIDDGYKYLTMYGGSELWINKNYGLLLDKIKDNNKIFKVKFKYTRK